MKHKCLDVKQELREGSEGAHLGSEVVGLQRKSGT